MPSTFFGLNIATSGMNAYNMGLNTTAHNISNRNTKGYSKQSVEQKAGIPLSLRTSYGMLGTGVEVTDIVSSRDDYYDYKYRKSNSVYGKLFKEKNTTNIYAKTFIIKGNFFLVSLIFKISYNPIIASKDINTAKALPPINNKGTNKAIKIIALRILFFIISSNHNYNKYNIKYFFLQEKKATNVA